MILKEMNMWVIVLAVILASPVLTGTSYAHDLSFTSQAQQDAVMKKIGVDEKPGAKLPLDTMFTDQDGKKVRLGGYFTGKPVVLTLNYYLCPMLCPITLSGLNRAMEGAGGLAPGRDYKVVTISINPDETSRDARERADETYKMVTKFKGPELWWPFLTGDEKDIEAVTKAVGFRYKRIDRLNIAHPTVFIVLTPEGEVSRYLYGVGPSSADLRLALIEAANGRVGASTALNRLLLFCYHYDPVGKKYAIVAINVMKIVGAVSLAMLSALMFFMWRYERGRKDA